LVFHLPYISKLKTMISRYEASQMIDSELGYKIACLNANRTGLNVDLSFDLYRSVHDLTEIAQKAANDHDFILLKQCISLAEKLYANGERLVKDVLENTFIYSFSRIVPAGKMQQCVFKAMIPKSFYSLYLKQMMVSNI
jgi:hypothetical protein